LGAAALPVLDFLTLPVCPRPAIDNSVEQAYENDTEDLENAAQRAPEASIV
jgi:hypothetical protein